MDRETGTEGGGYPMDRETGIHGEGCIPNTDNTSFQHQHTKDVY